MHNSITPEPVQQIISVIQSIKSGPIYYENYSKDMNYLLTDDEKKIFVNKTCLVFIGHDIDVPTDHIGFTLNKFLDWRKIIKMALRPSKSVYMLVTGKISYTEPNLYIKADALKQVKYFCYVGMEIDKVLCLTVVFIQLYLSKSSCMINVLTMTSLLQTLQIKFMRNKILYAENLSWLIRKLKKIEPFTITNSNFCTFLFLKKNLHP